MEEASIIFLTNNRRQDVKSPGLWETGRLAGSEEAGRLRAFRSSRAAVTAGCQDRPNKAHVRASRRLQRSPAHSYLQHHGWYGRWAQMRGLPRSAGHHRGARAVRRASGEPGVGNGPPRRLADRGAVYVDVLSRIFQSHLSRWRFGSAGSVIRHSALGLMPTMSVWAEM